MQKFAEILAFPHVIENYSFHQPQLVGKDGVPVDLVGHWAERQFGNAHPITLELACGRGEYTVALAARYPGRNFIGMDIKGARIWRGAKNALDAGLTNVAFLRSRIELVDHFFAPEEVDEIWITFPDPFSRKGQVNRRLVAPVFLDRYRKILKNDGLIHLKTDNDFYYHFALETIRDYPHTTLITHSGDIYAGELPHPDLDIKTYYERMHLEAGLTIKYVQFKLRKNG